MSLLTKLRPDPPVSDLEDLHAKAKAVDSKIADRTERKDKLNLALSLLRNIGDAERDRTAVARERVKDVIEYVKRRPDKVDLEIKDIDDELHDLRKEKEALFPDHEHAKSVRTSQRAIARQPAQRKIANRIAAALTELSQALDDARQLHADFAREAPNPTSVYLPTITDELAGFADLGVYTTAASRWSQRMIYLGIIPK